MSQKITDWRNQYKKISLTGKLKNWCARKWQSFLKILFDWMQILWWFLKRVLVGWAFGIIILTAFGAGLYNQTPLLPVAEAQDKFSNYPLLVKICKAESQNRQFAKDGDVLRGSVTPSDIGYCQINEPTWNDTARNLGKDYDIYTEEGNKNMAINIFLHEGSDPWNSSKCTAIRKTNCWSK